MSTFKSGTYGELLKWEKEQAEEKMKAEALKPKPPTHGERVIKILLENAKELSDALSNCADSKSEILKKITKQIVQASIKPYEKVHLHPNWAEGADPYDLPFKRPEFDSDEESGED